jgi:hypothetical protein
MRQFMIACGLCLCLLNISACSRGRVVPSPPEIIKVPVPQPLPEACRQLQAVVLPAGSAAQDVIEAQHAAILAYEAQVAACAH